MLITKF